MPPGRHRPAARSTLLRVASREILLLHGDEPFLVEDEARRTLARWRQGLTSEFGYESLDPSGLTPARLREAVLQVPFLDPYRVVAVRGITVRAAEGLAPGLSEVPESTRLLLTVAGRLPAGSKLARAVTAAGGRGQAYQRLRGRALGDWIRARTREYGLPPLVAAALGRAAGADLGVVDSELRKLAAYQAGGHPLDQRTVEELLVVNRQEEIFRLTDHLLPRPDAEAWRLLQDLLQREKPTTIAYALARHLATVLEVQAYRRRGLTLAEVQSRMRQHAYVVQKAYEASRTVDGDRLEAGLRAILAYEWEVKSGQIDPVLGLEVLLARL
ncbi:MAG TPA: DNA polymerase III subunit delta [Candidatus Dormibacteraeota bacterium]|nr:DNA polymerase III subunit delta [Candidatus Dormibacteraeota bacterium]